MSGSQSKFKNLEDVISWALVKTKPTRDFSKCLNTYAHHLCDLTREIAEDADFPIIDVILAGSVSRETYLPWSVDIDLFARLNVTTKAELARFTSVVLPKVSQAEESSIEFRYAENPYGHFLTKVMGREVGVDIVASIYARKENLRSALAISGMSRTPFHNHFLTRHIQGQEDQVRVLKWWFVRKRVYGQFGFTGFLTEFLIGYFGGFENIIKAAKEISHLHIDLNGRSSLELEEAFPGTQLVIVDPVDEQRNAAAGIQGIIGEFKMNRFLTSSSSTLSKPNTAFDECKITTPHLEIQANFIPAPRNPDEEGSRLSRLAALIRGALKEEGVEITDVFLERNPSRLLLMLNSFEFKSRIIKGPPESLTIPVSEFKSRHRETYLREKRLYAQKEPRFQTVKELVCDILSRHSWIVSPQLECRESIDSEEESGT